MSPNHSASDQAMHATPPADPRVRRLRIPGAKFWSICFAILAFEIGVFLTVFPWRDAWTLNHLPTLFPSIEPIWDDAHFKGAVSGLGLINIYVSLNQLVVLVRRQASQAGRVAK